MKKIGRMNEAAWLLGTLLCALGVCLCTKAGFGLSMIAAPQYILHVRLIELSPFFTQGTCGYLWQGALLLMMCLLLRQFRLKYLLVFAAGVAFGLAVDFWLLLCGGNGVCQSMVVRVILFVLGEVITALSVAFFFRTDLPLQINELIVTEFSAYYRMPNDKMKWLSDLAMLLLSVVLALVLHGDLTGVGIGTIIITAFNAALIGLFGKLLDKCFTFEPRFPRLVRLLGLNDRVNT